MRTVVLFRRVMTLAATTLLLLPMADGSAGETAAIDFDRDIRPILSNQCFACHGPDDEERQAGLRLDTHDGPFAETDSGAIAVVPGDPDVSELIARITSDDDSIRMPPADFAKQLSRRQIDLLTEWVRQGAPFAEHWSYVKPTRPTVPQTTGDSDWPKNEIDHFILARLNREGLQPSPEADRYALIRRVSLDLTGLPPTVEEVDRFVNDPDPRAYENLVDRLLAKKSYGEHWARKWLDLARYADSAGYADDPPRTIWAYRDYVIRALNENKPFDQFTIEQIAGDLLPDPMPEQLIATAFHRNTMTNNEGGTNDEEFRNVAVVDRVNTTMAVWMGTTMMCAQCHTHKYDPISQEEYFQFFAILNNTEDSDKRDESPTLVTFTDEQKQRRAELEQKIAEVKAQIASAGKDPSEDNEQQLPDRSGPIPIRYLRVQAIGEQMVLHVAEVEAFANSENVAVNGNATQSSTDYDAPAERAIDGVRDGEFFTGKSVTHTKREDNPWIEIDLGKQFHLDRVMVWNRTDGGTGERLKKFRFIAMDADHNPVWVRLIDYVPKPAASAQVPSRFEDFADVDRADLAAYVATVEGKTSPLQTKLDQLMKQLADIKGVTTPIMRELPAGKQRETRIQLRGDFLSTGKQVGLGLPAAFHSPDTDGPIDRLALAHWLVDEDNPLTARVIANRYWEAIFGAGLVLTSEEFGSQGDRPSHPDLLDWAATELVRLKWDTKAFLKLLVTSATYRQSSRVTPELLQRDPDNRLLARGPRVRLSAEMIRDQALAVSGLLSPKMYGPPVKPPQPSLGLSAAFGSGIDWQTSSGDDRYRRGLYTTWRRSNPYPSMVAFDAPNREVCTVRRDRTNTPLQALVTMNDPVYVEAAQSLARRIDAASGEIEDKARHGFRLCLSRPPSDEELKSLVTLFTKARNRFADNPSHAKQMATKPLGAAPDGADVIDLAAWTVVGNVLLNLDEIFMKR